MSCRSRLHKLRDFGWKRTRMAEEEQNQRCSNSSSGGCGSGGGRSSKKLKQKKIPQRGLGVAQLEKIRLQEQQKKDAAVAANAILSSPPTISPNSSSFLSVPLPNYHHNQSSSFVPLAPPSPTATHLSPPNSLLRPSASVPSVDVLHSNTVPLANSTTCGGFETGWPSIPVLGHGNGPKLWNWDYNIEGESKKLDPRSVFRANLPYETNPIWPLPNLMQRAQQYQQSSSSLVNFSSATSSSSVLKFQMEPPSNQSYYGNYTPLWPEEEKMVGMKRPYPFSLDNPPGPSFNCKFPSFATPITRSDESTSCGNGGTYNFDPGNPIFREAPSCSAPMSEPNLKDLKENGFYNGDFLTLAPPTTISPHLSSKFKHPLAYSASHNHKFSEFESLPYQGSAEDPILLPVPSGLIQPQPFYSFFLPAARAQTGQATTTSTINNGNGEVGESVDLNLKL
ncbi:hypothetical protein L1049_000807 [Liquidambar formosana]|uniref:Uncharacterized protein n=1 Tax=Liquidambar formosana TaxID=63359 RepID=A0AAP0R5P7_LIQFO